MQGRDAEVTIPAGGVEIAATLSVPEASHAIVAFAHGSGSSRHSPRNQSVARRLQQTNCATLLLDLLTRDEEEDDRSTNRLRFDVALLARRLQSAVDWCATTHAIAALPLGLFGASTGAAAALIAAAEAPHAIRAVVSRGGRPDMAIERLPEVTAPTLLIVGGDDTHVLELNRIALARLRCERELAVIPGASHLFQERGALERVADLAAQWFVRHLVATGPRSQSSATMRIITGDLSDPRVIELLRTHISNARAHTQPGSSHALGLSELRAPDISFWTMWEGEALIGMAALKRLSAEHGEVKSMHVAESARGKGAGRTLLLHIIAAARAQGFSRLSLETGSWDYFRPARELYRRHGFVECPPFADYRLDRNSIFMTLDLTSAFKRSEDL